MRKVICLPTNILPTQLEPGTKYISTYSNSHRSEVGHFGTTLINDVKRAGITPSVQAWDFCTIALSIAAADHSISRKKSPDGWTREIDLTIHVCDKNVWDLQIKRLEDTLRFLTGDFWHIHFESNGTSPPVPRRPKQYDCNCVSLLSGGVDSLAGAIDLVVDAQKPIFISQVVRGDAENQREFAKMIRPASPHFQWNHNISPPKGETEGSTRGRSIIFFAFAALSASAIRNTSEVDAPIYVPENGFISLNIPLNSGRMGSFSTKTTHPIYLSGIQSIWKSVGIPCELKMPYQFKTKGEVLAECKNQTLLKTLAFKSVSCGKYRVYKMQHCGRCVPCLVRRAAFQYWGESDLTSKGYYFDTDGRIQPGNPDDLGAMANACLIASAHGIRRLIGGALSFSDHSVKSNFENMISRGFEEMRQYLNRINVR